MGFMCISNSEKITRYFDPGFYENFFIFLSTYRFVIGLIVSFKSTSRTSRATKRHPITTSRESSKASRIIRLRTTL